MSKQYIVCTREVIAPGRIFFQFKALICVKCGQNNSIIMIL